MKISIVTINLNNKEGLKRTIKSVIEQTYSNIEYIIIDGASKDNSDKLIESYHNRIAFWISEPDSGIYNAMNKGIKHSTGDYVLFLNSGDYLSSFDIIAKYVNLNASADIVYGNLNVDYHGTIVEKIYPSKPSLTYLYNDSLPHPSMFFKRNLFTKLGGYNEQNKIASDWEFYFRLFISNSASFAKINLTVSVFIFDGLSSNESSQKLIELERKKVIQEIVPPYVEDLVMERNTLWNKLQTYKNSRCLRLTIQICNVINRFRRLKV